MNSEDKVVSTIQNLIGTQVNGLLLSRRDIFAAMAMQGLMSSPKRIANSQTGVSESILTQKEFARSAVLCADALIAELEKPKDG